MLSAGSPPGWAETDSQPAAPTAMTTPAMNGPLVANPNPISFDAGPLGPVYMTGAVSGLGLWQNNISPGDQHSLASLSKDQFFFQKIDGLLQYFLQVGAYTIPSLGRPCINTPKAIGDYFGPLPVAYINLVPSSTFSMRHTVDDRSRFSVHPRPGCRVDRCVDRRFDGWRKDIRKLQL
jgi:hypothetical protein